MECLNVNFSSCPQMADEEFRVSFSRLTRGKLLPILKAEKTESSFYGKKSVGIKVTLDDDDLEIVTWLPKKLVEGLSDDEFEAINNSGKGQEKYCVCYYGKMDNAKTTQFVGRIHKFGEGNMLLHFLF